MSASALVWSVSSAGATRDEIVGLVEVDAHLDAVLLAGFLDDVGEVLGRVAGLVQARAVRSISCRRSGTSPASNMPWRASLMSSAMSMPIGQASVQRPHKVQAS